MSRAILYDATQCIGCRQCEAGCAEQNHLPYDDKIALEEVGSSHKYTYVMSKPDGTFMRRLCMHCEDPTCVSVCPVGALTKTKAGPVVYDEDKCMGCRYCMTACPFGVPKYEWEKALPGIRKCTMCSERTSAGKPTACTEACPVGSTISGERSELLAEAHRRIRENPDLYLNHVFGEKEVGGTSVLMITKTPFEQFGFRASYSTEPLPLLTHRVLSKIPDVSALGFVLLGGIWWITNRRNDVAAAEHSEHELKQQSTKKGTES